MSLKGNLKSGKTLRGRINRLDILTVNAYEIAVKNGFNGTEEEWLISLEANPERIKQYVNEYMDANPVAVDTTLSVSGRAADAKSTGEAIEALQRTTENFATEVVNAHVNNKGNPHGVTIAQIGAAPASHLENKKNPHGVTPEQIGAQEQHIHFVVSLPVSGWSNNSQTVACEGVTANNTLIVASAPESYEAYSKAGVYCSAQALGSLTFTCKSVPDSDLSTNVMILT